MPAIHHPEPEWTPEEAPPRIEAPRLVLVEIAATDRFHRAVSFPYVLGRVRAAGVAAIWWRYALPADAGAARPALLDEETLGCLVERVEAFGGTHIIVGGGAVNELARRLAAEMPQVAIRREEDLTGGAAAPDASARWLGLDVLAAPGGAPPDFGFEAAHAAAAETPPLPFVVLGPECTFNAPLARNPVFAGVDLSECVRQGGCSFCARPTDPRGRRPLDQADLAAQVAALERTLPPRPEGLTRLAIRFVGEPALDGADQVARAVAASSLGPVDILLDGRADQLVRRRAALQRACWALEGTPHRVHMALVGVESFSRDELARMNKGLEPQDNLDAARTLMELERDFPGRFCFREHGGLSLITMTPWTTLDDLATTLHTVRGARLEGVVGKLLTGRVRLTPGLPMTALAAKDGLLLGDGASYDDPALDTAARNLYEAERPWRFADGRMEAVSRLLVRLGAPNPGRETAASPSATGDAVTDAVTELLLAAQDRGATDAELEAAAAVVDAARDAGADPRTPASLARKAALLLRPRRAGLAEGRGAVGERLRLAVALARAGLKPVTKLEPLTKREASQLVATLAGVAAVEIRQRRPPRQGWEAFVGVDAAAVARAAHLTARAEVSANDEGDTQAEIGRLLGYPACCAEAFSRDLPSASRDDYSWLHVARRVATPGPLDPLTHPWIGHLSQHYVPCSAACEETRRRAQATQEVFRQVFGAQAARAHLEMARHPWLVGLSGESRVLELVPTADPAVTAEGAVLRYAPGGATGLAAAESAALALAWQGDMLVLEGERVFVLRRGRRLGELTSRVFVWWHRQAFQVAWWERLVGLRRMTEARLEVTARTDAPPTAPTERPGALGLTALRQALREILRRGPVAWDLTPHGGRAATLRLQHGAVRVTLLVEAEGVRQQALITAGPWGFSYPPEEPLDTPAKRRLVRAVGRALRDTLERASPPAPYGAHLREKRRG